MRSILWLAPCLFAACIGDITTGGGDPVMPTGVQLVVRDGAAVQPGVRVVFQATDGTMVEATTDAAGMVTQDFAGGTVHVIRTYPAKAPGLPAPPAEIYTYVGVKNGDRLVLGHEVSDQVTGAINVKVPDTAQGTVTVTTQCGSGQGTAPNVAISTGGGCSGAMTFFVDDDGQQAFVSHAMFASSVDLSASSFVGNLAATMSAINVGPNINVDAELRIVDGNTLLYSTGTQGITGQPHTNDLPNVHGVDQVVVATISDGDSQMVARRQPYAVTPTILDASAGLIPSLRNASYSSDTSSITWTEEGTGAVDFVVASLQVTPGNIIQDPYMRYVIAPHAGPTLALPILAGADAIYNPTSNDNVNATPGLVTATGGYDAARARAFSVKDLTEIVPSGGTLTVSYNGANPPAFGP